MGKEGEANIGKQAAPEPRYKKEDYDPLTWDEHIEELKRRQEQNRRSSLSVDYAEVRIDDDKPVGVVLTSDWHLGANGTDYITFAEHMKLIHETEGVYMATLSNTIDNYIFMQGAWGQMYTPSQQIDIMKDFVSKYKEKILAVVGSNCHEGWTQDRADINVNAMMFDEAIRDQAPFLDNGGVVKVDLNGIEYTFGLTHRGQGHSSLNPTNLTRRLHDDRWPVDILVAAHHHVAQVLHAQKYENVFEKEVVMIRTGAYKRDDAFSEQRGFGKGEVRGASPMVIIHPKEKKITPFFKLEDGIDHLKRLRGES